MTSYQHILPSLIWLIVLQFSCRDEPSIDLMHENSTHYFFDAKQIYQSPPGKTENWQDSIAQSLEGKSPSPSGRMWIAINLTSNASYNYVFISMCRNVVQIFQDQTIIKEFSENMTASEFYGRFSQRAFFSLPISGRPSILYMQTSHSDESGYSPNCRWLENRTQTGTLFRFMTYELAELIAGSILLFIGLAAFLLFVLKRTLLFLYFSLFSMSAGLIYLMGSGVADLSFSAIESWRKLWYFCLIFTSAPFFLFIEKLQIKRNFIYIGFGTLNACFFVFNILMFWINSDLDFESMRRIYFKMIIFEILTLLPFTIQGMLQKFPFSRRLGLSILVVFIAATHDLLTMLYFDRQPVMFLPWALIIFVCILLSILLQIAIQHENEIEAAKNTAIQISNLKLKQEVEHRTYDLHIRNAELEKIHDNLEEQHELLANKMERVTEIALEKDNLLSRVTKLKNSILPKILEYLQELHEHHNDATQSKLITKVRELVKIIEPAAYQNKKSTIMSKRRLIILDDNRIHQRICRMSLGGSKIDMHIINSHDELKSAVKNTDFDLIALSNTFMLDDQLREWAIKKANIILLSTENHENNLKILQKNPLVLQVIPMNIPRPALQKILLIHLSKILSNDIFGLEKYLGWGFEVKELIFETTESSETFTRSIQNDLERMGLDSKRRESLVEFARCLIKIKQSNLLMSPLAEAPTPNSLHQICYGFDSNTAVLSINIVGQLLGRHEIVEILLQCLSDFGQTLPSLTQIIQDADAFIVNSDGKLRHEFLILTYFSEGPKASLGAAYFQFESI